MRMFAGATLYFSASFVTVGFVSSGELSEPSGEYEVITMPFERQNSTTSVWVHELYGEGMSGGVAQHVEGFNARVKLNLVNGRDNRGVGEKALQELDGEVGDA